MIPMRPTIYSNRQLAIHHNLGNTDSPPNQVGTQPKPNQTKLAPNWNLVGTQL
jgi:hypothetical protein